MKWLKTGKFELVANDDLVPDREPSRDEDAFTFEAMPGHLVSVACREILERRGEPALFRALRSEGHLDSLENDVRALLQDMRRRLRSTATWSEVEADLGDQAASFELHALRQLLTAALEKVDDDGTATAAASSSPLG